MEYEWDPNKNQHNIEKHRLHFQDAKVVLEDNRSDYAEQRFIAIGELQQRMVIVVYTLRQENICRIISMRKANVREKKIYRKQLEKLRHTQG